MRLSMETAEPRCFADDIAIHGFQQVLTRAIGIASLPLTQLNGTLTDLQNRSTELQTLNGKFSALQTATQAISTAVSSTTAQVFAPMEAPQLINLVGVHSACARCDCGMCSGNVVCTPRW